MSDFPRHHHTASPYSVSQYAVAEPRGPLGAFWSVLDPEGGVVAMQIRNEDDARLLAAAPDLYRAVRGITQDLQSNPEFLGDVIGRFISDEWWHLAATTRLVMTSQDNQEEPR